MSGYQLAWITALTFAADASPASLPDPTRPADYGSTPPMTQQPSTRNETSQPDWNLTAIRISDTRRIAIINDQLVREGQRVDGAEVVSITPETVVLNYKRKEHQVRLVPHTVKHAVKSLEEQ